jgi:exonuclease SbcC
VLYQNAQTATVKALQNEAKRLTQQFTSYNSVKDKNTEHAERINRVKAEWLTLCTRLNAVGNDFDVDSFRSMNSRIKNEKQDPSLLIQLTEC